MVTATLTTNQVLLASGLGGLAYLLVIGLVAALITGIVGDSPVLVVGTAIFWPALLIPVLIALAGYRLVGGQKLDGR